MVDAESAKSLTLFTRQRCSLCEHLALALDLLRIRYRFDYTKIDVDTDPALTERYGMRVPVLVDQGREVCAGRCDPETVEAYITAS